MICIALFLTSYEYCSKDQLEDAVDEREGKHDVELFLGEGELHDGGAQLSVLHPRFQSNCSAPTRHIKRIYAFMVSICCCVIV